MKKSVFALIAMFFGVMVNGVMGASLAVVVGVPVGVGAAVLNGVAIVSSVAGLMPKGVAFAGLFTEAWTGHMIKAFRDAAKSVGWYNRIPNFSQYAENDVIHFVNIGGDPTVLINNTTYPLGIQSLEDTDKAISLDKYQTQPTRITDDEMRALSYDKKKSVIERHKAAIEQKKYERAIHALAPQSGASNTPIVRTSGNVVNGFKQFTRADVIALKKAFDKAKVPNGERILVLCPDHIADLLEADQQFAGQYYNYTSGAIANLYGFEVYEYTGCPYYDVTAVTKKPFDAVVTDSDVQASVAFALSRTMRADGSTKAYASDAKDNPESQENLVSFRHYSVCLPFKEEMQAAIISARA